MEIKSVPTIAVKFIDSGAEAIINATDFNSSIHTKVVDSSESTGEAKPRETILITPPARSRPNKS